MRAAVAAVGLHMKDIHLTTETTTPSFTELDLNPALLKALDAEGYTNPTPIQAQAIPGVMAGRDLMGIAQTGTGKTAAFALPILHRLAADRRPPLRCGARALILSPTRELATQIAESFRTYGRHTGLSVAVMFGGMPFRPQVNAMARGVDILVATPGRLIDHIDQRSVNLSGTEILVLDEADQMLDMGFIAPIRQILSKLSQRRQSLFFSATMPREINALANEMLRDPLRVAVTPVSKTADRVAQSVIHIEPQKKQALLVELFGNPALKRTLVFTRTKRGADKVARHLGAAGIPVAAIHGNKSQRQRESALADFRNGRIRGLIATDIAARGIDIDEVSHVVNYELPNIPESYVHRIGRTARAGAEGIAISLCAGEENAYLRDIERVTRQQIPASDRRGDATLVVTHVAAGEKPERERGAGRGRMGAQGGERPFAGGRDADGKGRGGRIRRRPERPDRSSETRGESRRDGQGWGERRTAEAAPRDARRHDEQQNGAEHRQENRRHEGRRPEVRNRDGEQNNEARRGENRRADSRRAGPRQDDRRNESRAGEARHRDDRRSDGRNGEQRRGDARRNDQRQADGHRADAPRNGTRSAGARQQEGRRKDAGGGQKHGMQPRQRSKQREGGGGFAGLPRGTAASH